MHAGASLSYRRAAECGRASALTRACAAPGRPTWAAMCWCTTSTRASRRRGRSSRRPTAARPASRSRPATCGPSARAWRAAPTTARPTYNSARPRRPAPARLLGARRRRAGAWQGELRVLEHGRGGLQRCEACIKQPRQSCPAVYARHVQKELSVAPCLAGLHPWLSGRDCGLCAGWRRRTSPALGRTAGARASASPSGSAS